MTRAHPGTYVEWVGEEAVALDLESNSVHYLNASAALVYALIQECGYEEAIAEIHRRYGGHAGMTDELEALVDLLKEAGLLVDD